VSGRPAFTVTVHLIRHGQSEWNASRRLQGQADPPLSPLGQSQAVDLASSLLGVPLDAVLSSDLQRAMDTALILGASRGLAVHSEPALREQSLGVLEGMGVDEALALVSDLDWTDPDMSVEGGESLREVATRLGPLLRAISAGRHGQSVALVSHGDTIRVARALLTGAGVSGITADGVPNGSVLTLTV
jgi:broad specificity phosphatase PhoE